MQKQVTGWVGVLLVCLLLPGCGEEPAAPEVEDLPEEPAAPAFVEVLIEVGSPQYFPETERSAMDVLRGLAEEVASEGIEVDPGFDRPGQLQLIVKPVEEADAVYGGLKEAFEQAARRAVEVELAAQQSISEMKADEFKELQQLMQKLQQGLPIYLEQNGAKLDQRTLSRLIENALNARIEAEKLVESLQKQIDRERYATLLRVK